MVSLSHKTKQFFWLTVKITTVFASVFFIYWKLTKNETLRFADFVDFCTQNNLLAPKNLFTLFCFSFFNWLFEIKKWQILVTNHQNISLLTATNQCLASLTISLFTPNRFGEYVAKAVYFSKNEQKKIVGYNALGNGYQLGVTIFFGFLGFVFFAYQQHLTINFNKIIFTAIVVLGLLLLFYMAFKKLVFLKKWRAKLIQFKKTISTKTHYQIAVLSVLRYLLFSHQFYYILLLQVEIDYVAAISGITTVYLLSSFLPIISFLDVVVKSSVAVWVFSFLQVETTEILVTTTTMWTLNFGIPAILGSGFVLRYKPKFAV